MLVFTKKSDLKAFLAPLVAKKTSIGFVPTMGALHTGHLSLINKSTINNTKTVVSIFVNPTQFNNLKDLEKYPRNLEKDIEKISELNPEIIIYAPSVKDIYENSTVSKKFNFEGIENQMEGKHRPGHFDGVGTIVKKLFEIVSPTHAYFGEKDFQQLQIVKKMVALHKINITVIGCPILREPNGLAMSSRNEQLSIQSREKASLLYKNLVLSKKLFENKSAKEVERKLIILFEKEKDFTLEYFEICEEETLLPCKRKSKKKKYRAFIALFIDNVRLIDNISLN
jgi:pantoate--beta-alanine ligase